MNKSREEQKRKVAGNTKAAGHEVVTARAINTAGDKGKLKNSNRKQRKKHNLEKLPEATPA